MNIRKNEIEEVINNELNSAEERFGKEFKNTLIKLLSLEKMIQPIVPTIKSKVIELSKWNDYHNYPTVGALRQLYFRRNENGFDYCVEYGGIKGGKILINENKYFEWQSNRKIGKIEQ